MEDSKTSTHTIPCYDVVQCVEFSPYQWSSQLLAVGTATRVTVFACRFEEEDADIDGLEYTQVRDFQTGCRAAVIAFSPETSLNVLPKVLSFVTAGDDHKLRLYTSDLKSEDHVETFEGHGDFINSITFDPGDGFKIASTGDDLTCRLWSRDGEQQCLFPLTAPGMNVCWHQEEPAKILVAQKNGLIRIFSLHNNQPIMSLSCGQVPLMAADWSRHNSLLLAAVAGTDLVIFDQSISSLPIEKRQAHIEGSRDVKWSRCHESLIATMGRPGRQIKVFNTRHQQMHINTSLQVAHGISWHLQLPVIAVGGDKKVHLWIIESA